MTAQHAPGMWRIHLRRRKKNCITQQIFGCESDHEISCSGCKPENWCRYRVVSCCEERGVKTCAECAEYPCENIKECFEVTRSFEPKCREACTEDEYERLKKAFLEKEKNLSEIRGDFLGDGGYSEDVKEKGEE